MNMVNKNIYVLSSVGDITGSPVFCNFIHHNSSYENILNILKLNKEAYNIKLAQFREKLLISLVSLSNKYKEILESYQGTFNVLLSMYPPYDHKKKITELITLIKGRFNDYKTQLIELKSNNVIYHADQMVYLIDEYNKIIYHPNKKINSIYYPRSHQMIKLDLDKETNISDNDDNIELSDNEIMKSISIRSYVKN